MNVRMKNDSKISVTQKLKKLPWKKNVSFWIIT